MYSKMHGVQTASATHWCEVKTPPFAPPFLPLLLPLSPGEEEEVEGDAAEKAADPEELASGVEGASGEEGAPEEEVEGKLAVVLCCAASSELTTRSSPGRTSLTLSKPRGPKAQSSEATHQSEVPSAFSRALCGGRGGRF